ncbi:MAG: protoheme IX farnesyltransferase [Actinobacteria bacterium]|uniref:Protoheme IX farnesyltransferase n=1 Tax=freshwater metagenome TaxID=449393 RepID=A0A6J7P8B4_9ZZZZ|nr:protoheme IX farnesyltransferase [Actinomycetota bacterium]MSW04603.1 protoheme IX farnesyltransferase [Actinomycetota bacterium]MSY05852.1 protoheme IX farnesyltransferase [Actinomycetota bacterium]MSZ30154.1 protoheme IX farnesyltransferase [Actinomycetota bacterium]
MSALYEPNPAVPESPQALDEVSREPMGKVKQTGALNKLRIYFMLTKPRVIELLLVTTLPSMILAKGGLPSLGLMLSVLLGGALAAGGANTVNCYIERDRDQIMKRTHGRPLPMGEVSPKAALIFGLTLEAIAFIWLSLTANVLSASLALSAMLFYIFVYTIWLKPRSPQNIVIGGAAGAVPALVGWAAVTGSLAIAPWLLFLIIFLWTPPHFWALAVRYRDDYAKAGIPMLPVVKGLKVAGQQIFIYSVLVAIASVSLQLTGTVGWIYTASALILGSMFVGLAFRLMRGMTPESAIKFFMFSNTYLAILFAMVAVDVLVRNALG